MPDIDRSVMVVKPKQPFFDWVQSVDYEEGLTLDRVRDDSTSFLIPPIWDSSDQHKLLELCYEIVFEVELTGWHTDPALWPQQRDLKMFLKWFEVEFHSLVIDLCDGPIEVDDDEIDDYIEPGSNGH
jgi:hypothetical protein